MKKRQLHWLPITFFLVICNCVAARPKTRQAPLETGVVWNEIAMKHTKAGAPESALRVQAIIRELKHEHLWEKLHRIPTRAATDQEILSVHSPSYLNKVEKWAKGKAIYLDHEKWSPYRSDYVLQSARTAAGSLINLVYAVADGKVKNGFAIVRPPGHHASADHGMGFCIFNNVAIAARALRKTRHYKRIAIIDFDAHHGNGTQSIFEKDPDTLYVSFHEHPFWPFTGNVNERGVGNILNIPMPYESGDSAYLSEFDSKVRPAVLKFHPDFILVSAGYDGFWLDYMSSLGLTDLGYGELSQRLVSLAREVDHGKIVFTLEGGYDLDGLSYGVANSIKALLGRKDFLNPLGNPPF